MRLIDVAPTIADPLDLKLSPRVEGVPLLNKAFLDSGKYLTRTTIAVPGAEVLGTWTTQAVRKGDLKAIRRSEGWNRTLQGMEWKGDREELYNLSLDPFELNDLSTDHTPGAQFPPRRGARNASRLKRQLMRRWTRSTDVRPRAWATSTSPRSRHVST